MNRETTIAAVKALLLSAPTGQDRKDILYEITEDICPDCGEVLNGKTCYCTNDE